MLQKLIRFLPLAEKVINRRTTLPILTQVCVKEGYLSATDLENTVRMKVDDNRAYTIPLNIVKTVLKAKPGHLDIEVLEDKKVELCYGAGKLTFRGLNPEEFPKTPAGRFTALGTWSPDILRKLYSQLPYTSTDELKPALNGVYCNQNGSFKSCATDGHILRVINDLNRKKTARLQNRFAGIIPKKALQTLARTVKRDVTAAVSNTHLRLKIEQGLEFYVRLIDAPYPDYRLVIPKAFDGKVSFNKSQLEGLIREATPFVNRETKKGTFTIGPSSLEVEVEDPEKDIRWEARLPVKLRDGKGIRMGLNVQLLERVLQGIDEKEVLWQYGTPVTAGILTGINGRKPATLQLLMPIRIEDSHE